MELTYKRRIAATFILGPFLIAISINGVLNNFSDAAFFDETEVDVSNWVTLLIEIGLGSMIALCFFFYSIDQQTKSDDIQKRIKKLVDDLDEKTRQAVVEGINAYSRAADNDMKVKLTQDKEHVASEGSISFKIDAILKGEEKE